MVLYIYHIALLSYYVPASQFGDLCTIKLTWSQYAMQQAEQHVFSHPGTYSSFPADILGMERQVADVDNQRLINQLNHMLYSRLLKVSW